MATRCFMPPERSLADSCSAKSLSPTASRYLCGLRARAPPWRRRCRLQAVLDVLPHGQPAERGVGLEDHAAVAADAVDRLAVDEDLALGRRQQAGDGLEDRRLAAARGAEEDDDLADARLVGDVEGDVAHRLDVVARLRASR